MDGKSKTWHGRCPDWAEWEIAQAHIAALETELLLLRERLEAIIRERDHLARQLFTPGLNEDEREALRELWTKKSRRK